MEQGPEAVLPLARCERLLVQEIDGEIAVFDLEANRIHHLNRAVAIVWQHCDGRTSVSDLAAHLSAVTGEEVSKNSVWMALRQLQESKLLTEDAGISKVYTRGELLLAAGAVAGGAMLLPVVTSLIVPTAALAAGSGVSPPPTCIPKSSHGCVVNTDCCNEFQGGVLTLGCCKPSGNSGTNVCGTINPNGKCA